MHRFQDNTGREWCLSLNGWQLKRLKELIGFDARDHESIFKAASDPALLCDVLYVLCQDQANKDGITDQQFGEAMTGDAIDAAADAYMQESVDFFPLRQRPAMKAMLAKIQETQTQATKLAEEKLNGAAMDQMIAKAMSEANRKIDDLLAGMSTGNSSGTVPASPA